ncbi:hypothetical protein MJM59_24725, partial [Salmonella enterica subsp. enterica serovar Montevideo]|nr:hypothetical protein [Salmonella enterica subsp. enterica serovar Montevideo]
AFLAWQREKSPSSLLPEARGTVDGITRGKKSKETGVDAGRSREQEKEEINLTLVNFTPLNYRC